MAGLQIKPEHRWIEDMARAHFETTGQPTVVPWSAFVDEPYEPLPPKARRAIEEAFFGSYRETATDKQ